MAEARPVLHLLCGKIAAGKSTLAARLAQPSGTILLSEDEWLSGLYAGAINTPKDYMRYSAILRAQMADHIVALLEAGLSVVLDFQANTVESRAWMRSILDSAGADHQMHVLTPPDEVCLQRLRARNASQSHAFRVSEAQFHQVSRYFEPPSPEEGFYLVVHGDGTPRESS